MIEEVLGQIADTRNRIVDSLAAYQRNAKLYLEAEAAVRRRRGLVAESRSKIQHQGLRRVERLLRELISLRIDEGRLPDRQSPLVTGAPGFGGECDACDGYMPPTRVVMALPHDDDTFAYVHAECYVIWAAQCRLRAALRRIA